MTIQVTLTFPYYHVHHADIYGETLYQSKRIAHLVKLMKVKMERELEFQKRGFQLLGAIDALLTAATATQRHAPFVPTTPSYVDNDAVTKLE